jgi:hypothetical protein
MNAEDKARLEELSIKVYAAYAQNALLGVVRDLSKYSIEHKENRLAKALRILFADNVIEQGADGKDDGEGIGNAESLKRYKIVDIERARIFESKPTHILKWRALDKDVESANELKDFLGIDYHHISDFSEAEKIYIYFHEDEFDVHVENSNNKYYHRKDCVERRNKFVLKNIVEYEMTVNFTKYLRLFANTDTVCNDEQVTFGFDRYSISTVFDMNELDTIFAEYEKNYNLMTAFQTSLNKTLAWVDSVGGFDEAIKIIRKQIIDDIQKDHVRFTGDVKVISASYYYSSEYKLNRVFPYVKTVSHLLTYDTLYVGEEMSGTEISNLVAARLDMSSFNEDEQELEVA